MGLSPQTKIPDCIIDYELPACLIMLCLVAKWTRPSRQPITGRIATNNVANYIHTVLLKYNNHQPTTILTVVVQFQ